MNFDEIRLTMIKQQLRTCDVLNEQVLNTINITPREHFVQSAYKNLAYSDYHLPIGHDQVMMTPREEGLLLQSLNIKKDELVLEIGTGSGYLTALIARMCKNVITIDIYLDLIQSAKNALKQLSLNNVEFINTDGLVNYPNKIYDVIIITASLKKLPNEIIQRLSLGGRLFAIIGQEPIMGATLITRHTNGELSEQRLFETNLPKLISETIPKEFIL